MAELTRQKERLAAYTTQARFAVAQLYDRASLATEADDAASRSADAGAAFAALALSLLLALLPAAPASARSRRRQRADAQDAGRPRGRRAATTRASRPTTSRPSPPTASSSRPRRRRRSAPRRCAAWATWRWTPPTTASPAAHAADARLQGRDRALPGVPEGHPNDPGNDRVLYQLARAHEQGGKLEAALEDARPPGRRVPEDRATATKRSSAAARCCSRCATTPRPSSAYATVLKGDSGNAVPRARAVHAGLVAVQAGPARGRRCSRSSACSTSSSALRSDETDIDNLTSLSRADRELVEDTFRVTSLSLPNLQGAESIPPYVNSDERKRLRVPRLPAARRALHQAGPRQGRRRHLRRVRQAAAAARAGAAAAGARDRDLPAGRLRHAGARREEGLRRRATASTASSARPTPRAGSARSRWSRPTWPSWRATTTRWRRRARPAADYQEAVRWYRAYIGSFPDDPDTAQNNFLLAELLFEDKQLLRSRRRVREGRPTRYPAHAKSADAGYAALLGYAGLEKARRSATELPALQRTQRRQRAALRQGLPERPARRLGADQHGREAVRAEGQRARRRGGAAGAGARPAGRARAAPRGVDRGRRTPRSTRAPSPRPRRATARCWR